MVRTFVTPWPRFIHIGLRNVNSAPVSIDDSYGSADAINDTLYTTDGSRVMVQELAADYHRGCQVLGDD